MLTCIGMPLILRRVQDERLCEWLAPGWKTAGVDFPNQKSAVFHGPTRRVSPAINHGYNRTVHNGFSQSQAGSRNVREIFA